MWAFSLKPVPERLKQIRALPHREKHVSGRVMHRLFIYLPWTVRCGVGMICDTVDLPAFTEVAAEIALLSSKPP